jgi:uncharacterized membrane protein
MSEDKGSDALKDLPQEERDEVTKVLRVIKNSQSLLSIKEIRNKTKLSYTKVVKALAILKERKLIKSEKIGGRIVYGRCK